MSTSRSWCTELNLGKGLFQEFKKEVALNRCQLPFFPFFFGLLKHRFPSAYKSLRTAIMIASS